MSSRANSDQPASEIATAADADSSSVKASPVAGPRGFDGAKKVDSVKRHVLVGRHYEITLAAHEGFVYLSQIDRSQLFDTL